MGLLAVAVLIAFATLISNAPSAGPGPCLGKSPTITGTGGSDNLTGTAGDDVIDGRGGADTISGGGGNDVICGGDGNDTLNGDDGNDTFDGDPGSDTFDGGAGTGDTVTYETRTKGVSVINQGTADDGEPGENDNVKPTVENITGGAGSDVLSGGAEANTLRGGPGDDTLSGNDGNDTLDGGDGNDFLLRGGKGDDTLTGDAGNDNLQAGVGNDTADGGDGDDAVDGNKGNDTVIGGLGRDTLTGGEDVDTVKARDGVADASVDCGPPEFSVSALLSQTVDFGDLDLLDPAPVSCEFTTRGAINEGPNVRISGRPAKLTRAGKVPLKLSCPAGLPGGCAGRLTLQAVKPKSKIGTRKYKVPAGRTRTVQVPASSKAQGIIARRGRVAARATALEAGQKGPKTTVQGLAVKAP